VQDDDETDALFSAAEGGKEGDGGKEEADGGEEDMDGGQCQQDLDAVAIDKMWNPISKNCQDSYYNQNSLFLLYCWIHDWEILTDDAVQGLDDVQALYSNLSETKKQHLQQKVTLVLLNGFDCPVELDLITGQCFLWYLLSLWSSKGTRLSALAYINKCTALFHLFCIFGHMQSNELQTQLKMAMAGLKQSVAIEKPRGDGWIETGMEPMSFGLYKALCTWFLLMGGGEGNFGHLFLVVLWNLACHSDNTCTIQLQHFQWVEDSFQVFFAHQKND